MMGKVGASGTKMSECEHSFSLPSRLLCAEVRFNSSIGTHWERWETMTATPGLPIFYFYFYFKKCRGPWQYLRNDSSIEEAGG
jgi:hypothetical protein